MTPRQLIVFLFCLPAMSQVVHADDQADLAARLARATQGSIVQLEARTYAAGDLVVPDGVTVRGAGYNKTVIDASGHTDGFILRGTQKVHITDLSIRNARECDILASAAADVQLSRLFVSDSLTGAILNHCPRAHIENDVICRNRSGVCISDADASCMINCTLADNPAIALSVTHCRQMAVFNDLIVNSATGVYLGDDNVDLALDHNVYVASYIGKLEGEASRTTLAGWSRVSGFDAHSVCPNVEFADSKKDDYRPISRMEWSPALATTSGWGVAAMAGVQAPTSDIDGQPRQNAFGAGAYEAHFAAETPADGNSLVLSDKFYHFAGFHYNNCRKSAYN
jgi:hypothetical protein